jgi:Type II secretion system (T2SS), protein F
MSEFTAVVQESRTGPFISRTLVGKSASEITARLLDAGTAVAKVIERRDPHPLARGKISLKDVVYFMEQIENTLFLGMEPRLALKACAITISQSSKSGRNLQLVVAAMERMVAGGESLTNAAKHFPNLFSQVAVGLLEAGEGSGSLDESFRSIRILVARSENIRHQTSMLILQPAITLLMAALTVGIMIVYIVPQFRSLLDYLGGKLPWQTEFLISLSDLASHHARGHSGGLSLRHGWIAGLCKGKRVDSPDRDSDSGSQPVPVSRDSDKFCRGIRPTQEKQDDQSKRANAPQGYQLVFSISDGHCSRPYGIKVRRITCSSLGSRVRYYWRAKYPIFSIH